MDIRYRFITATAIELGRSMCRATCVGLYKRMKDLNEIEARERHNILIQYIMLIKVDANKTLQAH